MIKVCIPIVSVMILALFAPLLVVSQERVSTNVVINEVMYNPSGDETSGEWIEIYNKADVSVNITNWTLTDADGSAYDIKFPSLIFPAKSYIIIHIGTGINDTDFSDNVGHFYLGLGSPILSNSGDDISIFDANGICVDYMAYDDSKYIDPPPSGASWTGPNATASEGKSVARIPNGYDSDSGSDWKEKVPTPGKANDYVEPIIKDVVINEFMPSPNSDWNNDGTTNSTDEWIEIYNKNQTSSINLSGFYLDDIEGKGSYPYKIPQGTVIPPGGFLVFYANTTGIALNNNGDSVRLMDNLEREVDCINYTSSQYDISIGRYPDGAQNITNFTVPTPGKPNIVDNKPVVEEMWHEPEMPYEDEDVYIYANVTDDYGIDYVMLYYSINNESYINESMTLKSGNIYYKVIDMRSAGTFVKYYVKAWDTRGQKSAFIPAKNFTFLKRPPSSLNLHLNVSKSDVKVNEEFTAVVTVYFDDDKIAEGVDVTIGIEGEDEENGKTDSNGQFATTLRAPSVEGKYTVYATAIYNNLTAQDSITINVSKTVTPEPEVPKVTSLVQMPEEVTENDEVKITVEVEHIKNVDVYINISIDNSEIESYMMTKMGDAYAWSGGPYNAGTKVSYYIFVTDGEVYALYPEGAPTVTISFTVKKEEPPQKPQNITADIEMSDEVTLGNKLDISGRVMYENGSVVVNAEVSARYIELGDLIIGSDKSDKNGKFAISMESPEDDGRYTVLIEVKYGETYYSLEQNVTFKDSLKVNASLSKEKVKKGKELTISVYVERVTGLPAKGVEVSIESPGFLNKTGKTDDRGFFNCTIKAPKRSGSYQIYINVSSPTSNTTKTLQLNVEEDGKKQPGFNACVIILSLLTIALMHYFRGGRSPPQ